MQKVIYAFTCLWGTITKFGLFYPTKEQNKIVEKLNYYYDT